MKQFIPLFEDYCLLEHKKFKNLIPDSVVSIANEFSKKGFKLFIVGGAVRDFLMNKRPKDFDLATDAKPKDTVKIVEKLGFKTLEVGQQFGIVVVVDNLGDEYEIATFRTDVGKGRRPDGVEFTTIEGDVKRRDLTINALFYDINKEEIVDLVDGEYDIKTGTIKTVGKPQDRFDEDPLRKVRAIRFFARSGERFDKETEKALKADTSLEGVSGERIYEEFKKGIVQAKNPEIFVKTLYNMGYLQYFFSGIDLYTKKFINSRNPIIQVSWLLQDIDVKEVDKSLNKAKWNTKEINIIKWLLMAKTMNFEYSYTLIRRRDQIEIDDKIIKEWAELFPKAKKWIERLSSFDMELVNVEELVADIKPSERTNVIINKIKELW